MITYNKYKQLGHSAAPEDEFARYETKAVADIDKYTFYRLKSLKDYSTANLCGLCELIDLFYCDDRQINKKILSFTNDKYSETYGMPSNETTQTVYEKAYDIICAYFTREQLYRGV